MLTDHDWTRLARYVTGECSATEAEELRRWIEADPERVEAVAYMRDVNAAAGSGGTAGAAWDTPASWERLAARMSARAASSPVPLSAGRTPFSLSRRERGTGGEAPLWRRPAVRAAAVVLIGLGASLPWLWPRWGGAEREAGAGQGEMQEYTTARGMRLRLRLSDGTHVVLGVASRLRLPRSFGRAGARDLYLDGEAYFDVRYDAARPFRVHTATAVTQDLGTKFSLEGRDADTTARVVVAEGSVELRAQRLPPDRRGALLTAGQLGVLAPSGDALVRSDVDVRRELAWTEGKLVFDDVPLRDALPRLSRWYDLDFTLADSALGARVLTAEFGGEALAETLRLLAATLGVGYERQGRNVILSKRRER